MYWLGKLIYYFFYCFLVNVIAVLFFTKTAFGLLLSYSNFFFRFLVFLLFSLSILLSFNHFFSCFCNFLSWRLDIFLSLLFHLYVFLSICIFSEYYISWKQLLLLGNETITIFQIVFKKQEFFSVSFQVIGFLFSNFIVFWAQNTV